MAQGHYTPGDERPTSNWDTTSDKGKMVFAVVIVGALLLLIFATSMCSREEAVVPEGNQLTGADILQRNVDAAFREDGADNPRDDALPDVNTRNNVQLQQESRSRSGNGANDEEVKTAEEIELEVLQKQAEIERQREEIRQIRRDSVPSLLPENPPRPAKLGSY